MRGDGLWNDAGCGARRYICELCRAPSKPTSFFVPDASLPMPAAEMRGDSKWNDVGCGGAGAYLCG